MAKTKKATEKVPVRAAGLWILRGALAVCAGTFVIVAGISALHYHLLAAQATTTGFVGGLWPFLYVIGMLVTAGWLAYTLLPRQLLGKAPNRTPGDD